MFDNQSKGPSRPKVGSLPEDYLRAAIRGRQRPDRPRPFVIGVAGGTASGKTTVCEKIEEHLNDTRVCVVSQDNFYRPLSPTELEHVHDYNFDHPRAIDFEHMHACIHKLITEGRVRIPVYDFATHSRLETTKPINGADIVIIEGILVFSDGPLRDLMDMKVFVDTDSDTRLIRRIRRDLSDRGRDLASVLIQYERFVKPSFDSYILPTKQFADIIIPRGGDNFVAIDLLVEHLKLKIKEREQNLMEFSPFSKGMSAHIFRKRSDDDMVDTSSDSEDLGAGVLDSDGGM